MTELDKDVEKRFDEQFFYQKDAQPSKLKKFLAQELASAKEKERQKIIDLLTSGKGRETGIWHYELNDHSEMEASYTGDYLSLKEVMNQLTNPEESNQ